MRLRGLAAVAAWWLVGWSGGGTAGAQSACAELGGTVGQDQICHGHVVTGNYTLDLSYPVSYPDQQPLADYLIHTRDEWTTDAQAYPPRARPSYLLTITGTAYRSATSSTQTLVLDINEDLGAHPVGSFKAFNYDLGRRVPITFDTLFKPGTKPLDVLNPVVARELGPSPFGDLGTDAYQNFAITDDAVIFFFGQGQVLAEVDGPQQVSVPRATLASLMAV
ncbi:esterase [Mycobacterium sp.]|uniref:esterase n=1 Tax=Mycobacterium sp. TaxID=1785 RepID=UPI003F96144E